MADTTRSLKARLRASDKISDKLDSIAENAEVASAAFSGLSSEAVEAGQSLEFVQERGEDAAKALRGITDDSGAAAGSLKAVEEQVEKASDEMSEGSAAAETYQSALSNWGSGNVVAQNEAVASSIDEVGDEASEAAAEVAAFNAAKIGSGSKRTSGSGFEDIWDTFGGADFNFTSSSGAASDASDAFRGGARADGRGGSSDGGGGSSDGEDYSSSEDGRGGLGSFISDIKGRLNGLWDQSGRSTIESFGVELGKEDVERIREISDTFDSIPQNIRKTSGSLSEVSDRTEIAKAEAQGFASQLDSFDGFTGDQFDELTKSSSNIDELEYKTRQIDKNLADDLFGDLSDDARDMVDASFAGERDIENTRRFKNQIDETGDEATKTAAEMSGANSAVNAWITNAMLGRSATSSFAREVDELGDEMSETAGEGAAMNAMASDLADANVNFGPMNLSLARMAQILPGVIAMLGSLLTVVGGFSIGGLGAVAGLGAILGGGAWFIGDQIAAGNPDISGPMEGLKELGSRIKPEIESALQPLKKANFGTLFMDTIEGAISFIGDLATSFSRLSSSLIPFFDRLGAKFWQEEPAFFAEMEKLIVAMLPYVEDFIVYFLENMPDALAFVREESTKLLPVWGDFLTSTIELFGVLAKLGGVIFNAVLPPLTLLVDLATSILGPIVTVLAPVVEALAAAFSWLADAIWPVIKPFAQAIGISLALAYGFSAASAAATYLATAITGTLIPSITALLASNPLGWAVLAIGAIVVLLDKLGWLDDILGWITGLFGDLGDAVSDFFKNLDEGILPALSELKADLEDIAGEYVIDVVLDILGVKNPQKTIQNLKEKPVQTGLKTGKNIGLAPKGSGSLATELSEGLLHSLSLGMLGDPTSFKDLSDKSDKGGKPRKGGPNSNVGTQRGIRGGGTNINIYANSDNPRRLGRIARREVEKANEENRKRTGSGN